MSQAALARNTIRIGAIALRVFEHVVTQPLSYAVLVSVNKLPSADHIHWSDSSVPNWCAMFIRYSSVVLTVVLTSGFAVLAQDETAFQTPLGKLELQDGDSIVFLGDSITHQRLYTQYVEDFFYTRFPEMRLKFHNSGVGGAKAWDALQRFDRDVAAYKPKYVTVLLGMNDGRYQAYNEEIFQTYHADMTTLIDRINEIGAVPILMTPTMFDSRARPATMIPSTMHIHRHAMIHV